MLPKGHGRHYLKLIVISMGRRYANWVRSGDSVRAAAMASLIRKMGLELPGSAPVRKLPPEPAVTRTIVC